MIIKVIAQMIGIVAMVFNILSYQQKKHRTAIAFQFIGSALFGINYLLINAYMGALLNIIGVIRALVFMNRDKLKADHILWQIGFVAAYLGCYVLTFTVMGTSFSGWKPILELLPVIGMVATTISYRYKEAKAIRYFGFISSPAWLTYNIACGSIGAICCEVLALISIISGILRLDRKRKTNTASTDEEKL